jgi:hypothetical protein
VLCLTVILSDFVNYFAPLVHTERIPLSREQVWSSLRGHRHRAHAARKRILERQISEDAQVEQDELSTRNNVSIWIPDLAATVLTSGA